MSSRRARGPVNAARQQVSVRRNGGVENRWNVGLDHQEACACNPPGERAADDPMTTPLIAVFAHVLLGNLLAAFLIVALSILLARHAELTLTAVLR